MLPIHLALVSLTSSVGFAEVAIVSAAIQKQLARDFAPLWNTDATIDAFATLPDTPVDYWKIIVVDTFDHGGQHRLRNQQPYALVAAGSSWSLVASHEALEMLADPSGNRTIAGPSPMAGQGRVEFLVEVCDPCQGDEFAYAVNGVMVSDFYTQNYFDPAVASGVRYSFSGAIAEPRQVLSGGYLSWRDPVSGNWFQENRFAGAQAFKDLGQIQPAAGNLRGMIDALSPATHTLSKLHPDRHSMRRISAGRQSAAASSAAQAQEIQSLLRRVGVGGVN
jgi:hypothetical protein